MPLPDGFVNILPFNTSCPVAQLPMFARLAMANNARRILTIENFINEWTYHQE
jgi:hypothetical protein